MKKLIFYLFMGAFLFTSCKEVNDEAHKKDHKTDMEKVVQENQAALDCFSSYNIYPATAWVWSESYVSYEKTKDSSSPMRTSPVVFFSTDNLKILKKQIESFEGEGGVLLYYIMADIKDTAPSLAMVNTLNCGLVYRKGIDCTDCALVSWSEGNGNYPKQQLISSESLSKYRLKWQEYMDGIQEKDKGFTEVNGYNYSWLTFDKVMLNEIAIAVKFGLRTLEPTDSLTFSTADTIKMTGSVVVSNVLVGKSNIPLTYDGLVAMQGTQELDFAKPCPTFCGEE